MIYETETYKKLKDKPQDNFPVKIFVHHTNGIKKNPKADTSHHTAKVVEAGHIAPPNNFEGIGYHEFIEKDGKVWLGRPAHYHGAHVKENGWNFKSIAICLAGNFDVFLPTKEQEKSLAERIKLNMQKFNISVKNIEPHRKALGNLPYKSCYGKRLSDEWARDLVTLPTESNKEKIKSDIKKLVDLL